jgi:hypothetical protein
MRARYYKFGQVLTVPVPIVENFGTPGRLMVRVGTSEKSVVVSFHPQIFGWPRDLGLMIKSDMDIEFTPGIERLGAVFKIAC